ncbi:hypothetical protein [Streptomyces sp. NPDC047315]|uniref:hypothetical protein n=1 Tax=Streptomyces sp. NPDC047315 TaxID=3155142 RepID=UPI0033ECB4BA
MSASEREPRPPSMRDLLAACAAAKAVSTPPRAERRESLKGAVDAEGVEQQETTDGRARRTAA